mmetsp:Transcript_17712/g.26827  ORF Transcript_17712/g.26827 Transcript_17712/m.26827 type:complete len:321 (+) Transcript_17712:117-1079(+)
MMTWKRMAIWKRMVFSIVAIVVLRYQIRYLNNLNNQITVNNETLGQLSFTRHKEWYAAADAVDKINRQNHHDASIILISSLIPSHPSIHMINSTIHSIHQYITNLPMHIPIYIVVDGLTPEQKQANASNAQRHRRYQNNLQQAISSNQTFLPFTNVTVTVLQEHHHVAGSIHQLMTSNVDTEFVYILQHDLPFCHNPKRPNYQWIHHTRLIQAMKKQPGVLYNVRFRHNNGKRTLHSYCPELLLGANDINTTTTNDNSSDFQIHGLDFFATASWSDQNHLSTKSYYLKLLQHIEAHSKLRHLKQFPEAPMMKIAREDCVH